MQIEIYNMIPVGENIFISLEAVCDSFSSLLWNIEYYKCGAFEVYIAASPRNIEIFQTGRIVGRDDDKEHFGLIESSATLPAPTPLGARLRPNWNLAVPSSPTN